MLNIIFDLGKKQILSARRLRIRFESFSPRWLARWGIGGIIDGISIFPA
jgi:hypothetical protein